MSRRKAEMPDNGFGEWGGYMNAKKAKLTEQFDAESVKSGLKVDELFKGVKIFVNGYTEPSADELRVLMMKHGGQYHHYLKTGDTTHIVASNLPDSKISMAKQHKIVRPDWIVDSIRANKILNFDNYLLITNKSKSQSALFGASTSMKNTADKDFLEEFYANSRLHHISTMGATFKEYVNDLRSNKSHELPGRESLKGKYSDQLLSDGNVVMHIDMDCFFVSVGLRNKPHLKGKPVAVTHSKGGAGSHREGADLLKEIEAYRRKLGYLPGVESNRMTDNTSQTSASMAEIASCSYEARQFGIKNGMFVGQALKLCPQLQFIHYDFEGYKEVSYLLYDSVARYTLDIEAVSCDEMYVDLKSFFRDVNIPPMEFATLLRKELLEKTGCFSSVGFGCNKLIARLATRKAKPNGQFWIRDDEISEFFYELPIADLPGVGRSTSHKLKEFGLITCGDLQLWSLQELQKNLGKKQGETLYNACRGKELKGLVFTHVRKSVSADVNYGIRLANDADRDTFLRNLSDEVAKRVATVRMKGRCVTLKLMIRTKDAPEESAKYMGHGICDHVTKSSSLLKTISSSDEIYREVQKIVKQLHVDSKELRGIGITLSRLEPSAPRENKLKDLFSAASEKYQNQAGKSKVETALLPNEIPPTNKTNAAQSSELRHFRGSSSRTSPREEQRTNIKAKRPNKVDRFILSPAELRVMIRKWIESEEKPKERDKRIIIRNLVQLCFEGKIDDVFVILKSCHVYVKRCNKSSLWVDAYQFILESVQTTMVSCFGAKLKMGEYSFQ